MGLFVDVGIVEWDEAWSGLSSGGSTWTSFPMTPFRASASRSSCTEMLPDLSASTCKRDLTLLCAVLAYSYGSHTSTRTSYQNLYQCSYFYLIEDSSEIFIARWVNHWAKNNQQMTTKLNKFIP